MKLEDKAWKIINIKKSLRELMFSYNSLKMKNNKTFDLLVKSKNNLKNAQTLHWNNKAVRDSVSFIKLYDSIKSIYQDILSMYNLETKMLKTHKLSIKERQREISRLNNE